MTLNGTELAGRDALVVGGTGNVGFFLVDGFLRAGARVARVVGLIGDIGTPAGAAALRTQVVERTDRLHAVAAAPAGWHQTPSMYQAGFASVIENSLYPHYLAAETFLPLLTAGGSYTTINGPVGFIGPPRPGIGPMAVVSVAQNKLIEAFGVETGGDPRVNDVVMMAFLAPQGTRPGSPLTGEQVGDYVAALASPAGIGVHNRTLHLRDPRQVDAAQAGDFSAPTTDG